jgi:hypothetical protein
MVVFLVTPPDLVYFMSVTDHISDLLYVMSATNINPMAETADGPPLIFLV